jgi:SpoVK/Ycf46/Vps4 family AAA+-type ATPase
LRLSNNTRLLKSCSLASLDRALAALLRPGRLDRCVYLGVSETHAQQAHILRALCRKFALAADVSLDAVAEQCPLNFSGADFYALASDALIAAYRRKTDWVDACVAEAASGGTLSSDVDPHSTEGVSAPSAHTSAAGLAVSLSASTSAVALAASANIKPKAASRATTTAVTARSFLAALPESALGVRVTAADFENALAALQPSLSVDELAHYARLRAQFQGRRGGA